MSNLLPLYFAHGPAGTVYRGSIRAGWTPFFQAKLYMIRSNYHHNTKARNDTVFASRVVEGIKEYRQEVQLHKHIEQWCMEQFGYVPRFGETYLNYYSEPELYKQYEKCERGFSYKVYFADFNSEEDRFHFQLKWQS